MTGWAGVDWSQAPIWATHWAMDGDGNCYWYGFEFAWNYVVEAWRTQRCFSRAPTFGYTGRPQDSLTVRPAHVE